MDQFNFIITVFCLIFVSSINVNYAAKLWRRNLSITTSPPPSQATVPSKSRVFPFKPSIIVMVGVLTFIFFITFLLLLYAKHCRRANYTYDFTYSYSTGSSRRFPPVTDQKNSGVERAVVQSLPVFRFESLRGQKDGLECAVCLNKFEDDEDLRLLPNCMHGFHVECVDTWLDAHSSCPLCRQRINSGQISMVKEYRFLQQPENVSAILPMENESQEVVGGVSRVSGRHSFAGRTLEVIVETTKTDSEQPFSGRRSLDSWIFRQITISEMAFVEHPRKDGLLLPETASSTGQSLEQWRLDHRITVSQEAKSEDEEGIIVSRQAKCEDEKDRLNHRCSDTQQPLDVC